MITSLQGKKSNLLFQLQRSQPLYPWSLITSVIELFIGHKYKEQESPLPDGGAAIHLDEERDFCQPSRPYESNCSSGSFLLQVEMIWEPQSITQAWPGPSAATTAATCGTPVSLRAPSPPRTLTELDLGYTEL